MEPARKQRFHLHEQKIEAVRSYRSQFARILEKNGWATLLERMARRTAELAATLEQVSRDENDLAQAVERVGG